MQLYDFVFVMLIKVAQEGNYKVKGEHIIMQDSVSLVKTRDINDVGHSIHHMCAAVFKCSKGFPNITVFAFICLCLEL